MTNLEFYKDEIYEIQKDLFDKGLCISDSIGVAICNVCKKQTGLSAYMPMVLDWLLEERKEPIKLTKFEYDLLEYYTYVDNSWNGRILHENYAIRYMCDKGYLKNVDLNMTFREVLDNCEVVEDE